ncbi:hypothetical protein RUM43_003481 [Polyplax serrata]|uniref:UPF3 domain-containing protein n=1 Tax=Polyplax serrata TaxID=468196 RepID=A0AAN8RX14_POLSC
MEVEEKTLPIIEGSEESNPKKEKILTLLFPTEPQQTEGKGNRKDKNKPPTKVVIRRLPPKFTKEAFIEEFSPLPAHDYFHFVRGDLNLGIHAFSRAYINFLNQEDIFSFKEKYDDYDLQDEKGRTYHAVVEFAAFQKIPKRNVVKKKLSKVGTLESDPKYIEFLQKLEESKNFINNPSEYFHETENSALKTKIITTPLLEFLKKKRQKKIEVRNEIRQRKREAEREKKRKDEEKRKAEREKRKEEKKNSEKSKSVEEKTEKSDDRSKDKRNEDRGRVKDDKKDLKNRKNLEKDSASEEKVYSVIPNDPAILEVVVRRPEKETKQGGKTACKGNDEAKSIKNNDSETNLGKTERKHSDFRTRIVEEKQRKSFYKRDADDTKTVKMNSGNRKGIPDEKGDNYNIGNCGEVKEKKSEAKPDGERHEYSKVEVKETKSKFRYSEQRNRDREYRQKTSDCKNPKEIQPGAGEAKGRGKDSDERGGSGKPNQEDVKKSSSEPKVSDGAKMAATGGRDAESVTGRRKSLEIEREPMDTERKRSKSFHDVSSKEFFGFDGGKKKRESSTVDKESGQAEDGSKDLTEEDSKKDPRTERRIRNKDRPSIEIYRPGMGKFSKQRLEQKKDDQNSNTSPTGTPYPSNKSNRFAYKANSKKVHGEGKNPFRGDESEGQKNGEGNGKCQTEVRTMTFNRSKEN